MSLIRQISRRTVVLQNTEAEVATAKTLSPYYEWTVNGELELPTEIAIGQVNHTDGENVFYQIRTTARQAGNSTYRIKIVSYNLVGGSPITHVDTQVVYDTDNRTYLLPLADAFIPSDRVVELRLFEDVQGSSPAQDVTISASLGKFTVSSVFGSGAPVSSTPIVPFLNWMINGAVNLPIETPIGTMHYLEINKDISSIRITARTGGTSTYRVKIISRDINGLNPITHVDDTVILANDLETYSIPVSIANVAVNRKMELVLLEENILTSAEDISVTAFLDEV